jgi:hypothetical protein
MNTIFSVSACALVGGSENLTFPVHERASPVSAQLLAAHIYYRALLTVPSIIRAWLDGCRDIQLSSAVVAYTSRYFSPVIIKTELARVKSQEAIAELTDENMVVKVSNNVNEVTAVYSVDEHQLSITLKLPSDWPLHVIKITDDRVAVPESHWRAWVLGVQQIIWSQVLSPPPLTGSVGLVSDYCVLRTVGLLTGLPCSSGISRSTSKAK